MKTTFTENFPQIWPLSCIFPLLTGIGCLPLTLKKKPELCLGRIISYKVMANIMPSMGIKKK